MACVDLRKILTDPKNVWSPQTSVRFPDDKDFVNVTERWTTFNPPTFAAAISPATEDDVIKAIKLARLHDIPFLATGARHGYSPTLGRLKGGLALDLSQINMVDIDHTAGILTVGGGTSLSQLFDPLDEAGYEILPPLLIYKTQILASLVYLGPESEAREAAKPILELNPPIKNLAVVPWSKLLATHGFGFDAAVNAKNIVRAIYGSNTRQISASTYDKVFAKMQAFYAANPDARTSLVELEIFPNQATAAVPHDRTSYPWRDAQGYMLPFFMWTERGGKTEEIVKKFGPDLRRDFVAASGYPDLQVTIPYAFGDETLEQIYGPDKLPRLSALKKAWDPDNVFAYLHPLPTEYPKTAKGKVSSTP
ncbi:hypothetical protein SLS62_000989 [Diatrype stigma]|uniref:FAD-binding PCMH-type domain-containing protein n=1 Tax=Diatrype stigma TaxID=117547 RepID=A0AAN9UZ45_9PEZI